MFRLQPSKRLISYASLHFEFRRVAPVPVPDGPRISIPSRQVGPSLVPLGSGDDGSCCAADARPARGRDFPVTFPSVNFRNLSCHGDGSAGFSWLSLSQSCVGLPFKLFQSERGQMGLEWGPQRCRSRTAVRHPGSQVEGCPRVTVPRALLPLQAGSGPLGRWREAGPGPLPHGTLSGVRSLPLWLQNLQH